MTRNVQREYQWKNQLSREALCSIACSQVLPNDISSSRLPPPLKYLFHSIVPERCSYHGVLNMWRWSDVVRQSNDRIFSSNHFVFFLSLALNAPKRRQSIASWNCPYALWLWVQKDHLYFQMICFYGLSPFRI